MNSIKEMAERNADIPTEEMEKDILDTEREIVQLEAEIEHLASTPLSSPDARLNHIKADARRSGVRSRKEFIVKLKSILEYRRMQA